MDTLKEVTKIAESLKVKVCSKCGKAKYGSDVNLNNSWCNKCVEGVKNDKEHRKKEQQKENARKYYLANKEKVKARSRLYYKENKERLTEKRKKYFKEYGKKYRAEHKDYYREHQKKYHHENKERFINYRKEYYQKNKDWLKQRIVDGVDSLSDYYCGQKIQRATGLAHEDITPEMIKIKRLEMTLKRLIR